VIGEDWWGVRTHRRSSVNIPGFNIVASAGQRQGEQISLIAAAVKRRDPMKEMAKEIAMLRRLHLAAYESKALSSSKSE